MMVEQSEYDAALLATLQRHWGYASFRPMQLKVMRSILNGADTLALLPTGGGKSLCFQVPSLVSGKLCVVVSPLIALMKDQVERLRSKGIAARALTSEMGRAEMDNTLENAAVGKLSFLYISPERLGSELFLARLPRLPLGMIAVDEAHCISQWGYDFRPSYLKIKELRQLRPGVPVLALTASATEQVAADIMGQLAFGKPNLLRGDFRRPELVLWVSRGEDKYGRLLRILQHVEGTSIVYMRERKGTVRIAQFLQSHGVSAAAYHAGMAPAERDRVQNDWMTGKTRCVVATNAFGMGIDKADVRSVVHMEAPPDLESYYQEAGRGGRDGKTAHAFLLVGPGDEARAKEKVQQGFPPLASVRKAYQCFADLNAIALGSGLQESYPLDLRTIAARTQLPIATVAHCFKALELGGYLALSEGARTPSRVFIRADQRVIYQLRVNDQRYGPLLEKLLRLYGGLFEEAATIDEERLAHLMEKPVVHVTTLLTELDRMGTLSYKPRSNHPSATLLLGRADADRLQLDPAALRDREERAKSRLHAMLDYMGAKDRCRMGMLLTYFNEPRTEDCGRCDVCSAKRNTANGTVAEPLDPYQIDIEAERLRRDEAGPHGILR